MGTFDIRDVNDHGWREQTLDDVQNFMRDGSATIDQYNALLQAAAEQGLVEIVNLLIPVADPLDNASLALKLAAAGGHTEVVKALIPVADPLANDSAALGMAALRGHMDAVNALIPVSDAGAQDAWAFRTAASRGHLAVARRLLEVTDVEHTGQQLVNQERWLILDQLGESLLRVGKKEGLVDGWLSEYSNHLPFSAQRRLADVRMERAEVLEIPTRERGPRVRC